MSPTPKKTAVKIDEFPLPQGKLLYGILACGVMMLLCRREVLAAGSPLHDHVLAHQAPWVLRLARRVQTGVFYFLFGAHAVECVLFATGNLKWHRVPFFSWVWFQWMAACFVGGQFAFWHFDEVVRRKEGEEAAKRD